MANMRGKRAEWKFRGLRSPDSG